MNILDLLILVPNILFLNLSESSVHSFSRKLNHVEIFVVYAFTPHDYAQVFEALI